MNHRLSKTRTMQIVFHCPSCEHITRSDLKEGSGKIRCTACGWSKALREADDSETGPSCCLLCGCHDLWRQKDFPPGVGLAVVGIGALASTTAIYFYRPVIAIGILMGFALLDLVLYLCMADVLVCYRCGSRHRRTEIDEQHASFDLEVAERYRQEAQRLAEHSRTMHQSGDVQKPTAGT